MTAPSSSPRGERAGRPGTTWNTQLARTEHVIDDDSPATAPPNRATRRALKRASRRKK